MAKKKLSSDAERQSPPDSSMDEARLAGLLAQPEWTRRQAQQVLAAQVHSRLTIAQFAKERGVTAGRLYNWKTKLRPAPRPAPRSEDPEGEAQNLGSAQDVELDLQNAGERFLYDYLQRATQGPQPTWRLLATRRQGSALWCVVRWAQYTEEAGSYSLVELELTEPAVRWNDFPTAEAATQALQQRCLCAVVSPREPSVPTLLPVQVRGQKAPPYVRSAKPQPPQAFVPCMILCLPSGVRIQISGGVPKPLMRTVLRALGAHSC